MRDGSDQLDKYIIRYSLAKIFLQLKVMRVQQPHLEYDDPV
jgi:hypothetical protein